MFRVLYKILLFVFILSTPLFASTKCKIYYGAKGGSGTMVTQSVDCDVVSYTMYMLGFDIYDTCEIEDVTAGMHYLERERRKSYEIKLLDKNFKLEEGDILTCGKHVEFYLGNTNKDGSDCFGWGQVYNKFPRHYPIIQDSNSTGSARYNDTYWRVYRYTGKER